MMKITYLPSKRRQKFDVFRNQGCREYKNNDDENETVHLACHARILGGGYICFLDKNGPETVGENGGYNDVAFFAGQFITLDENGEVSGLLRGYQLNQADPSEISLISESWEEAVALIKSWLPDFVVTAVLRVAGMDHTDSDNQVMVHTLRFLRQLAFHEQTVVKG